MKRIAFLVGIDLNAHFGRIGTCDADVRRISQMLRDQYGFETHCYSSEADGGDYLAGDEKLSKRPIGFPKSRFDALLQLIKQYPKGSPEDMVIFYYAGHGVNTDLNSANGLVGGLVPTGASPLNPGSLVSLASVIEAFEENWDPGHLLVILDCCFATSLRWGGGKQDFADLPKLSGEHFQEFLRKKSRQVLTSTIYQPAPAHDLGGSKHSPFALGLIEGLGQQKARLVPPKTGSLITITQLHQFLSEFVKETCHDLAGLEPGLWSLPKHDRGEFFFAPPTWKISISNPADRLQNLANPYKGLSFYAQQDSDSFFGRKSDVCALINELEMNRLLILSAESGTGKSSLLHAGVIGTLMKEAPAKWEVHEAIAMLGTAVQLKSVSEILTAFESTEPKSFKRHLFVLDQFERISSPALSEHDVFSFLSLIIRIVKNESLNACILIGIRSDFEYLLRATKPMENYSGAKWYPLKEMGVADLERAIRYPAYRAGVFFDSGMVEQLLAQMTGFPKALGILNLLLHNLYDKVKGDRLIRKEYWGEKHELKGYLNEKMEEIYLELGDTKRRNSLMCLMLRLVEKYDTKYVRRLAFNWELQSEDQEENERIEEIRSLLTEKGILLPAAPMPTNSNPDRPEPKIELSHDIIVESWDRLQLWINKHKKQFGALQELMSRARQYQANNTVNMSAKDLKRMETSLGRHMLKK